MPLLRSRLPWAAALAVIASGLLIPAAPAQASVPAEGLILNEVYGGGGSTSTSASYKADFIEIYNPTSAPVSLNGASLQYRSGTYNGTGAVSVLPLPDQSVAPNGYFLVQTSLDAGCTGGALCGGAYLPAPDFTATSTTLNMSGTGGQAILASTTSSITATGSSMHTAAGVVDFVGYGSTPTSSETAPTGAATSTTTSVQRKSFQDTNNNSADFAAPATPSPKNASDGALSMSAVSNKTGIVGKAITGFTLSAVGGAKPYTFDATGLPTGVSVDSSTGAVSGTPTAECDCAVTATVSDAAGATKSQSFTFTVNAFSVTNPGSKSYIKDEAITPFTIAVTGGTAPYAFAVTSGDLPAGLTLDGATGQVSGTPTATQDATPVTVTVTDNDGDSATTTFSIAVGTVLAIAEVQGTDARSPYAGTGTSQGPTAVTTQGVITAIYTKGFAASGAATCGFCGFYLQTPGTPETPGASDAIFVYGGSGFTGAGLAVGDSVRATGKVSEFNADATGSLTELNATTASAVTPVASLGTVTPATAVPALADREAHEGELFAPTDLVITDTYNFELYGELGLASGGKPLVQPTEACVASDTACIAGVQQDIRDRGVFFEDGSTTGFLSGSTMYRPKNSNNSDIPLPFIDKTHSARVGATVTFPVGAVLDYRNKKWYLQPQRAVSSTHGGEPDLGTDVVTIEDTRVANAAPANVGGDLKVATYNVENYFNVTGKAFEQANPYYSCSWDYDRDDNPTLTYQCTSPQAIPSAWDPVTGAPTAYKSGVVSSPRGAARQEDLDRQTDKIVKAINGLGADVVSLEELGNVNKLRMGVTNGPLNPDSSKADQGLGTPIAWRDSSIQYLVDHLNSDAGAGTWGFVASPQESTDATSVAGMCSTKQPDGSPVDGPTATAGTCSWASGQDVIRSGFLYRKSTVVPVGESDLDLPGSSAPVPSPFDNAREPLAQFFKPVGHPNSDGFAVVVNHFKSKGDSDPKATGGNANDPLVGAFNAARVAQAKELLRFANQFAAKWRTQKVFLVGDFNSYTGEDPVQTILHDPANTLGFDLVTSDDPDDLTYVYTATVDGVGYGGAGSLDHVFASEALRSSITGTDVWEINSNEPGVYNYSRYHTNQTDFWDGTKPFGGSDHNPEIIGFDVADSAPVTDIQILGTNDFHGRLLGSSSDGGAAQLAGAVKSLKSVYGPDNSVFVAAGDLIGASTFESFVQKDKPTLEALNAAGLQVSAVGNHEFDQGYRDLLDRVMKPYDADTNPYGADGGLQWQYIGSNVVYHADPDGTGPKQAGDPIVLPTATKTVGGVKIGFVGAVTEDLMGLVNPAGMENIDVKPIVSTVNGYADQLKADGAKLVVVLLHEGAPSTDCATMTSDGSTFASIVNGIDDSVDAVISGHTHLEYACQFTVPGWEGRAITKRPVMSAGQYGVALDQLVYSFDGAGNPVDVVVNTVGVKGPGSTLFSYPEDPTVKAIVDAAVAAAEAPGARVLGQIAGPFNRARLGDGTTENRGGESTLGNLVAEIQRWATPVATGIAPAQIAFMNPGGLRADLKGSGADGAKDVTYKEAAAVQPFANTLVNVDMTGAQIKRVLEQQWQRDASGNVPSRPFLRLGTSKGFTYTYDETADPDHPGAKLGRVTGMWLDGTPIKDTTSYSVTMNSFLASGGDNFRAFAQGADKRDTGITDLQAQVDYMAGNAAEAPLAVDFAQHAVGVRFPDGAPTAYHPGDHVRLDVSSWAMTGPSDAQDSTIQVKLGGTTLDSFPVDNAASSSPNDDAGKATIDVVLPAGTRNGARTLQLVGATTGTSVPVTVQVDGGLEDVQVLATNDFHGRIQNDSGSAAAGAAVLAGAVKQLRAANPDTVFAAAGDLIGASTFESFIQHDKPTIDALNSAGLEVSAVGNHELDKGYDDLVNRVMKAYDADTNPTGGAEWQYIAANLKIKATGDPAVPATWIKTMGSVKVGFVGAVTEDLPSLVSPDGIKDLQVAPIVSSVNDSAADLKAAGADVVVMLVHEGAPSTDCTKMTNPATAWGQIVTGVSGDVDAIVSGHTHLAYNCSFPVASWSARPVTERPVVSAGQYGSNLNQLVFTVDTSTHQVQATSQGLLKLKSCTNSTACTNYPADSATAQIVSTAVAAAVEPGKKVLGSVAAPFGRAKFAGGGENRGGESTLGNLVAEVQRWATPAATVGAADIAFMNPGGLRTDMAGTVVEGSRQVTYREAANVQPFANTLVNMDLTGRQIKTVLEQQWQRTAANTVPTRAFLRLGTSNGFTYTYTQAQDPAQAAGVKKGTVTGMWLDGAPIDLDATYSVTVNSFLAAGGDNFWELANGATKQDTGMTDLQAMVDYLAAKATDSALPVDYRQHAVDVTFPADAPASYRPGDHVVVDLGSLSMTNAGDTTDDQVQVKAGDQVLGTAPVTTTVSSSADNSANSNDDAGTSHVDVVVPDGLPVGATELTVVGNHTGTVVRVPVTLEAAPAATVTASVPASVAWGAPAEITVSVAGNGATPTGSVSLVEGDSAVGEPVTLDGDGRATLTVPARALEPGEHTLTVRYTGSYPDATDTVALTVTKAVATVTAGNVSTTYGKASTVTVTVSPAAATGTVTVLDGATVLGTATVTDGRATVSVPAKSVDPGSSTLTAAYSGDAHHSSGSDTFTMTVAKASSSTNATARPATVKVRKPGPTLTITVTGASGIVATGKVSVAVPGQGTKTATLTRGRATVKVGKFTSTGTKRIRVVYQGDRYLLGSTDTVTVKVTR